MYEKSLVALSAAVLLTVAGAAPAADAAKSKSAAAAATNRGEMWTAIVRWPDFTTGMWMLENGALPQRSTQGATKEPNAATPDPRAVPVGVVLTPQAQARKAALKKGLEGATADCVPPGPLGIRILPQAFFYAGDSIFIITDMDDFLVRRVIMNRKEHGDPDPTWAGHSIGHWEGDTLVIDTVAVSPSIKLFDLQAGANLHIVERVRLLDPNRLEWRYTVTDPDILAQPWEFRSTFKRHKDWEIQASSCAEGNRDMRNEDGTPSVDLTPK